MISHSCEACGEPFESRRRDARFCSPKCRKAAWAGAPLTKPPIALPGPVERETRAVLASIDIGGADDVARSAIRLAMALDDPGTPASALTGLSKQLPETVRWLRDLHGDGAA